MEHWSAPPSNRQDGDSGIKGAIAGTLAESAVRVAAPLIGTYALGWLVQFGARKAWQGIVGSDPVDERGGLKSRAA